MGPTTGLDATEKKQISFPYRESNPGRPHRSPSLDRLSYSGSCAKLFHTLNAQIRWGRTLRRKEEGKRKRIIGGEEDRRKRRRKNRSQERRREDGNGRQGEGR
jgi:hypothetical protein